MYLAEHPAVCVIESLVNLKGNPDFFPDTFSLMKVSVDAMVSVTHITADALPGEWRESYGSTRFMGDSWLAGGASALLAVPSAPSPESLNYLFNPRHPDAEGVTIERHTRVAYDKRLFRASASSKATAMEKDSVKNSSSKAISIRQ